MLFFKRGVLEIMFTLLVRTNGEIIKTVSINLISRDNNVISVRRKIESDVTNYIYKIFKTFYIICDEGFDFHWSDIICWVYLRFYNLQLLGLNG